MKRPYLAMESRLGESVYGTSLGVKHETSDLGEIVDARGFTTSDSTIPFLSATSRKIELMSLEYLASKSIMS
jgi:hypothetical protein